MRIPDSLTEMAEHGLVEEVVRPLMSGKEAQVFLVVSGGRECIAKVYKGAEDRAFKNRAAYTEGREARKSRDRRALAKRTSYGRSKDEESWHSAEVAMLRHLRAAGVRVPVPLRYMDGVLIMELIADEHGEPAPRLGELTLTAEAATAIYETLLRDVIRMLCAGVVHGDLSDYNVLLGSDGPVIIDLPQAVNASKNPNARAMLLRDVDNLHRFLARHAPGVKIRRLAEEMWHLYENNQLTPDTQLRGDHVPSLLAADTGAVLDLIDEAETDERFRRQARGLPVAASRPRRHRDGDRPRGDRSRGAHPPAPPAAPIQSDEARVKANLKAMMAAIERGEKQPWSAPPPKPPADRPRGDAPPRDRPPRRRRRPRS